MDHEPKSSGGYCCCNRVGGLAYIISQILKVLNMDIDQIEDGIKKMIVNILKDEMRNKITFQFNYSVRMMIVKDAIEKWIGEKNLKTNYWLLWKELR